MCLGIKKPLQDWLVIGISCRQLEKIMYKTIPGVSCVKIK